MIARQPCEADYLHLHDDVARWYRITRDFQLTLSTGLADFRVVARKASVLGVEGSDEFERLLIIELSQKPGNCRHIGF
jgi:hypothetical protein